MNVQHVEAFAVTTDRAVPTGNVGNVVSPLSPSGESANGLEVDVIGYDSTGHVVTSGLAITVQLYVQAGDGSWSSSGTPVVLGAGVSDVLPFPTTPNARRAYVRATSISGCTGYQIRTGDSVRVPTSFAADAAANVVAALGATTTAVSINSQKLTNIATPTTATDAATKGYVDSQVHSGTGSPDGAVTAPVGSVFVQTDAPGAMWAKTSGAGNTGWSLIKGGVGTYVGGSPGPATPDVTGVGYLVIANTGATSITNFTGGVPGQVLVLEFRDANTTITQANAVLPGGTPFTSNIYRTLTLVKSGAGAGYWTGIGNESNG